MLAFFGESRIPRCQEVSPEEVPEPFHKLLVHNKHMTVTLEEYFGQPVEVHPYVVHQGGDWYGRKLDLAIPPDGQVVMTGLMMVNFGFCTDRVRERIVEQKTPLGRILIENNILREISTESFLRIDAEDPLIARFGGAGDRDGYGRIATIFCDGSPAVDLLEVVTPYA